MGEVRQRLYTHLKVTFLAVRTTSWKETRVVFVG